MLNLIVILPLIAALLLCFVPRNFRVIFQAVSFLVTLLTMILAIVMFCRFDSAIAGYQFEKQIVWVKSLGISYHLGVDGINVGLILMGAIVAFARTAHTLRGASASLSGKADSVAVIDHHQSIIGLC